MKTSNKLMLIFMALFLLFGSVPGIPLGAGQASATTLQAPVASAATNIQSTSFTANWQTSVGATGYRLDVAEDAAFTCFVVGYTNTDVGNVTQWNVTGLAPLTPYYYRLSAYNGSQMNSPNTNVITIITLPPTPVVLPVVATLSATGISSTAATVNGSIDARGIDTSVSFDYGPTDAYGSNVAAVPATVTGNVESAVSAILAGLAPNTTYHYRAVGTNLSGTVYGEDKTITTPAIAVPTDEYSPSSNTYSPTATVTTAPATTEAEPVNPGAAKTEHVSTFTLDSDRCTLDGVSTSMGTAVFGQDGRVFVPQRFLGLGLGIANDDTHMTWDDKTKTATFVTAEGKQASCSLGSKVLTFDGQEIQMGVEPLARDGFIFLPARFLTDALGGTATWDDSTKTVTIRISY